MKRYLFLQFKRMMRILPFVLIITLVLFSGIAAVFIGLMQFQSNSENVKKFKIAIVGDRDNRYINLGVSTLQTLDDTRFSFELIQLEEAEAKSALERQDISAYFVLPDQFVEAVRNGEIKTIRLVTNVGASGVVLIFKEELARAATELLIESQKGVYGVQNALDYNGHPELSHEYLNRMNLKYIDFIVHRSDLYQIEVLGISNSLTLPQYFFCSFTVFLLMLMGLPYAVLLVRKEWTLYRTLAAKQISAPKQIVGEYAAYTGSQLFLVALITVILFLTVDAFGFSEMLGLKAGILPFALRMIPVMIMLAAFNFMIFELSGNIVNGVLLQFFCCISLCYAAGCFFPIYTFPKTVQAIAPFLPTGLARSYLAASISGSSSIAELIGILAFTALFITIAVLLRKRKISVKAV